MVKKKNIPNYLLRGTKVIGGNRLPLLVYQGATTNFDNRDFNYFTLNESEAKNYGGKVRAVYLNIKKPLEKNSNLFWTLKKYFNKKTGKEFDILSNSREGLKTQSEFFGFLKGKGYDGLTYLHEDGKFSPMSDNQYVVSFNPKQIIPADAERKNDSANCQYKAHGKNMDADEFISHLSEEHKEPYKFVLKNSCIDKGNYLSVAKKIISLYNKDLEHHFKEEEMMYEKEETPACKEFIEEHKVMRAVIKRLKEKLKLKDVSEFMSLLKQHIENEEKCFNSMIDEWHNETSSEIEFEYKSGGQVLLAPNGKKSNLNPKQYEIVRSRTFKEFFGDWENALRFVPAIDFEELDVTVTKKEETHWLKENVVDEIFVNEDTGLKIYLPNKNIGKLMSDGHEDFRRFLKSIKLLPKIIEKSLLGFDKPDRNDDKNILRVYKLYACIRNQRGELFSAKLTVKKLYSLDGGDFKYMLYDYRLESIETTNPVSISVNSSDFSATIRQPITGFIGTNVGNLFVSTKYYDLKYIPSQVIDENGEPIVCHHGTNANFYVFDKKRARTDGFHGRGFYFTQKKHQATSYGEKILPVFLNSKSVFDINESYTVKEIKRILGERFSQIEDLINYEVEISYDGRIGGFVFYSFAGNDALMDAGYDSIKHGDNYIVFESNQIKLANGTNKTFDINNDDIRFANGGNIHYKHKPKFRKGEILKLKGYGDLRVNDLGWIEPPLSPFNDYLYDFKINPKSRTPDLSLYEYELEMMLEDYDTGVDYEKSYDRYIAAGVSQTGNPPLNFNKFIEKINKSIYYSQNTELVQSEKMAGFAKKYAVYKNKFEFGGKVELGIGDYTTIGKIQDEYGNQFKINDNWYHKSIVKAGEPELIEQNIEQKKVRTFYNGIKIPKRINPRMIISAFANPVDWKKVEKYAEVMRTEMLSNNFPPIEGFPSIIDETDVGKEFLSGDEITEDDIGKIAWNVTNGHHRSVAAIEANLPYLETELDYSTITNAQELKDGGQIENFRKFLLENNRKVAKEKGLRTEGDYIFLYHGTSPANYKKILKSNKFKSGTWFADNENEANIFGRQGIKSGKPVIATSLIYMGSLIYNGYFSSNEDLYYENSRYSPKSMVRMKNGGTVYYKNNFKIIPNEQTPKTEKIKDVKKFISEHSEELDEFLSFAKSVYGAQALASNQVSLNGKRIMHRFFAVSDLGWKLIINPTIDEFIGEKELKHEGCLSFKCKKINALRSPKIKVSYYTIDGNKVEGETLSGYEAQVWQHEIEHLDGRKKHIEEMNPVGKFICENVIEFEYGGRV